MDKLVELFVQSARYGESGEESALSKVPADGGHLDEQAIEHGIAAIGKMLGSEDGLKMGAHPPATFVCLGMALEEKPLLQAGAIRCYEEGLRMLDMMRDRNKASVSSWERATVLQQLANACLKQKRPKEAAAWLHECSKECGEAEGHPRDVVLFGGSFSTQQTRLDFIGTVEKLSAKAWHECGDEVRSRQHYEEVQRLSRMQSCDAVERTVAQAEAKTAQRPSGDAPLGDPTVPLVDDKTLDPKALWAATAVEKRRLKEYRFVDEGPTVMLILDLNDHLGIGEEASSAVDSLKQFRVKCEAEQVDVRCRLQREDGKVYEFQLLLQPMINEIVPEDTVPRLKGREGKRRLEVKLFKRDKKVSWNHDLVKSNSYVDKDELKEAKKAKAKAEAAAQAPAAAKAPVARTVGTMLNPLTAAELAALPRPNTTGNDNRPSSWAGSGPVLLKKEEPKPQTAPSVASTDVSRSASSKDKHIPLPAWVASVDVRRPPDGSLELDVHIGDEAAKAEDLELEGDEVAGLRLRLQGAAGTPLELSVPKGTDPAAFTVKWRKKTRVLELRLPNM